jgi:hypothetical protein
MRYPKLLAVTATMSVAVAGAGGLAGLTQAAASVPPAVVGYYDIDLGQGNASQEPPITGAGATAVHLTGLTEGDLAGLDALVVQKTWSSTAYYLQQLPIITAAVEAGMDLIMHDREVGSAEVLLPNSGGFDIREDFTDAANIDILDDTTLLTDGPGGVLTNSSLDGGFYSTHGFTVSGSLPGPAKRLLSTGDPAHIVNFCYAQGAGSITYSSIPLDHYLNFKNYYGPTSVYYRLGHNYALNAMAYVASGGCNSVPADTTPPVIVATTTPSAPDGDNGWYTSDVSVTWNVSDAQSTVTSAFGCGAHTQSVDSASDVPLTCSATSAGGTAQESVTIKRDATAPVASLVGGPEDGETYWTTTVPAAPTCSATDATSGVASCVISDYSSAAGSHEVTATATDNAGNTHAVSSSYIVRDMTFTGFYNPVDMGSVYNVIKGGSSVPLKFNVLIDGVQQTDIGVIEHFTATLNPCDASAPTDTVEIVTTGGTALRYDTAGGQFIQNWKTPTTTGKCYRATATLDDGDKITALFKIK